MKFLIVNKTDIELCCDVLEGDTSQIRYLLLEVVIVLATLHSLSLLSLLHIQHFIINMKCNNWHCQHSNINPSPTLPLRIPGFTFGFLMWIPSKRIFLWIMLLISTLFIADNWLQIYKARYWIPNINLVKFRWTVKTKTTGFHLLFLLRPSFHNEAHSF